MVGMMMVIKAILTGYFMTCVYADGVADVVLTCTLVEEGAGLGGMGGGHFTRTPATLILRDVAVGPDESLEELTPFVPPSIPDPDLLLFEAKVSSPEIPNANVLLHADCNEQEVMCELSSYSPRGFEENSDRVFFMVSLSVDEVDFSTALILETLKVEKDESTLMQSKLGLPLSQSGTLLTDLIFVVFTHIKSVSAPLRSDVPSEKARTEETSNNYYSVCLVDGERAGSSINAAQVVGEGNASLTLTTLKVGDEGTYICTVSLGPFHSQQVIQLRMIQPPDVSLSVEKLVLKSSSSQKLSCHSSKYYPLDSQIEWFSLSPTDTEPQLFKDQGSLSSHRQHGDGTFTLSSHIAVPPTTVPGTKIICKVSHTALEEPLFVSVVVEPPEPNSYWWILGFLIITVLFFYQVMG
ncbi:tapasin-related protein [Oreochromis aureus]|uniref:tapasin-related protein n=1 Tax=Oreochromis aureus TaxID=47969 RepID=UPI001954E487|nr:tapasin-related protein [Oreochromis aureus]